MLPSVFPGLGKPAEGVFSVFPGLGKSAEGVFSVFPGLGKPAEGVFSVFPGLGKPIYMRASGRLVLRHVCALLDGHGAAGCFWA